MSYKQQYYDAPTATWIDVGSVVQEVVAGGAGGVLYMDITKMPPKTLGSIYNVASLIKYYSTLEIV